MKVNIVHELGEGVNLGSTIQILQHIKGVHAETYPFRTPEISADIAVGSGGKTYDAVRAAFENEVKHFVQKRRPDYHYELLSSALITAKPESILKNPISFLLRSSINTQTNMTWDYKVSSTQKKEEALNELDKFVETRPRLRSLYDTIYQICDELLLNAIYCAPTDEKGEYLYRGKSRRMMVELPEDKNSLLFLVEKDAQLLIGCMDNYGSIDLDYVIGRLYNICDEERPAQIQSGEGGAGIGLKMILDESNGLYLVNKKNKATLVCATLMLGVGLRKSREYPKNLHLVQV
jgi:hypothetical protein